MTSRLISPDRGDRGERVDLVLRRHLRDVPAATRTQVQHWIRSGHVTVNGRIVRRVAQRAAPGDAIVIQLPPLPARAVMSPESMPLSVLYEDAGMLVVDKPAGLVVHPTYKHQSGTLLNAVLWYARAWPRGERPSVVGRLDKLTSGIVVIAKTERMHAALQRAFASRATEKDYLAVSYGEVRRQRGTIRLRLSRDPEDRRRVVASTTTGDDAETEFTRVAVAPHGLTLLRCRLRTGRTHQIRVHLSASGWPIVGDPNYSDEEWQAVTDEEVRGELRGVARQALHAWRLSFPHPADGRRVTVESPVPSDIRRLLRVIGLGEAVWTT